MYIVRRCNNWGNPEVECSTYNEAREVAEDLDSRYSDEIIILDGNEEVWSNR